MVRIIVSALNDFSLQLEAVLLYSVTRANEYEPTTSFIWYQIDLPGKLYIQASSRMEEDCKLESDKRIELRKDLWPGRHGYMYIYYNSQPEHTNCKNIYSRATEDAVCIRHALTAFNLALITRFSFDVWVVTNSHYWSYGTSSDMLGPSCFRCHIYFAYWLPHSLSVIYENMIGCGKLYIFTVESCHSNCMFYLAN